MAQLTFDQTAVDQCADRLVSEFAESISPLVGYLTVMYGNHGAFTSLPLTQKLFTLRVAEHAASYGDFPTDFTRRRLANQALDFALRLLKQDGIETDDRLTVAVIVGRLAATIAHSYGE